MRPPWLAPLPPAALQQEVARQAAILRREAFVRFPAMALAFAV